MDQFDADHQPHPRAKPTAEPAEMGSARHRRRVEFAHRATRVAKGIAGIGGHWRGPQLLLADLLGQADFRVHARKRNGQQRAQPGQRPCQHRCQHQHGEQPPLAMSFQVGRLVDGGGHNRAVRADLFAESAVDAFGWRDADVPFRHLRQQPQDRAVGTEKAAVRPADEQAQDQQGSAENQHARAAAKAEEGDERIVTANDKGGAGGREEYGRAEVEVTNQPQGMVQPPRNGQVADGDQFLHRAERADSGAERAAEKEREDQRQVKKTTTLTGTTIGGIEQGQGDVLGRSDRADAAAAPESEPEERRDGQQQQVAPRPGDQGEIGCQRQRHQQRRHVHRLPQIGPCVGYRGRRDRMVGELGSRNQFRRPMACQQEKKKPGQSDAQQPCHEDCTRSASSRAARFDGVFAFCLINGSACFFIR